MEYAQSRQSRLRPGQDVPDGALLGQAQAGDQHAFEVLVQRYHPHLAGYIRFYLTESDQLADVLQQVYLQLYLSLPTRLPDVPLRGWLLRVARSRCLDELRRMRHRAETPFSSLERDASAEESSLIETIPDPGPLPEEVAERGELMWSLRAALVALPSRHRLVVQLHCFRHLTFAQIGSLLNIREATVKSCFYRALPRLRKALAVKPASSRRLVERNREDVSERRLPLWLSN